MLHLLAGNGEREQAAPEERAQTRLYPLNSLTPRPIVEVGSAQEKRLKAFRKRALMRSTSANAISSQTTTTISSLVVLPRRRTL